MRDGAELVDMDPVIGIYRDKYVEDLSRRLGINDDRLPGSYTIMTLLNPLFGLKPVIVGSKLMTETQYDHAREGVVRLIQEELDSKNPITSSGAKDGDDNSLDWLRGRCAALNHTRCRSTFPNANSDASFPT